MSLLRWGLCPAASVALEGMGIPADRIVQTIGSAPASAGVHAQDGTIDGAAYCGATDFSVHHPSQWSESDVKEFLSHLADKGFAAFHRVPGQGGWPCSDAEHIHAVYAGVALKPALQTQVHEWLHGGNGLVGDAPYTEWQPTEAQRQTVRALFLAHNPA